MPPGAAAALCGGGAAERDADATSAAAPVSSRKRRRVASFGEAGGELGMRYKRYRASGNESTVLPAASPATRIAAVLLHTANDGSKCRRRLLLFTSRKDALHAVEIPGAQQALLDEAAMAPLDMHSIEKKHEANHEHNRKQRKMWRHKLLRM
jgi:hypothetical protein